MKRAIGALGAAVMVAMLPSPAHAEMDIRAYLVGGRIRTGGRDDATNQEILVAHAYSYMFGEDPLNLYSITDPGFNSLVGDLTPGSPLRFSIHSSLLYWNGAGPVSFSAAPPLAALNLTKFEPPATLLEAVITGATGEQDGFSLGTVLGDGRLHQHVSSTLSMTDASTPPDGIYAFRLSLLLGVNESTRSDPFYVLYGSGVDESALEAATTFLDAAAVPEPGSLLLLALGATGLLLKNRRRLRPATVPV